MRMMNSSKCIRKIYPYRINAWKKPRFIQIDDARIRCWRNSLIDLYFLFLRVFSCFAIPRKNRYSLVHLHVSAMSSLLRSRQPFWPFVDDWKRKREFIECVTIMLLAMFFTRKNASFRFAGLSAASTKKYVTPEGNSWRNCHAHRHDRAFKVTTLVT